MGSPSLPCSSRARAKKGKDVVSVIRAGVRPGVTVQYSTGSRRGRWLGQVTLSRAGFTLKRRHKL